MVSVEVSLQSHHGIEFKGLMYMERSIHRWLWAIGAVGIAAVSTYIGWFYGHLGKGLSDDPGVWGQFGDYLGGFLNPLIAGAALYWLTQSVRIQHRELAETKAELAKTASSQAAQVTLAALAAELIATSAAFTALTEDITHFRSLQRMLVEQISGTSYSGILGFDGKSMNHDQALRALSEMESTVVESMAARGSLLRRIVDLGAEVAGMKAQLHA